MRTTALKISLAAALALGLGLLPSAPALGAATGSFSPTNSMGTMRNGPAAAPLPGGGALIAGGYDGSTHLPSAETFNPATNTFSPTPGPLGTGRSGAAAAPLFDGRVLVAGGFTGSLPFYLDTAEIFNPTAGTFGPVAATMGAHRNYPVAALLPDRRVLIAGGENSTSPFYLASAEVFNPADNTFSPVVAPMTTMRSGAAAAPLPDGRVLIAGGYDGTYLKSAEIFDPATYTFSPTGPMGTAREHAAAAPLPDGRVLVAGGLSGATDIQSAEIFDPATNTFSPTGSLGEPREGLGAAALADGRILIAGGYDSGTYLKSAALFTLAKPSTALSFTVKGKSLVVTVAVPGTVSVAASGVKKKKKLRLKPSSASGGPGQITVPLRLAGPAKKQLKKTGKVSIRATISFAPSAKPGECVAVFKQCYSSQYAASQTATLRIKRRGGHKK
jgi:hypothetical protein